MSEQNGSITSARPQARLMAKIDPLGLGGAAGRAGVRALRRPGELGRAATRFATGAAQVPVATATVLQGKDTEPVVPGAGRDRRFADPAWSKNPAFFALRQYYDLLARLADDVAEAGRSGSPDDKKVEFLLGLVRDGLAPTNFLLSNPDALVTAFRSGGLSVARGARLAIRDAVYNGGRPVKIDRDAFTLGEDLATTPGQVVFRNELIELIQYAPQTDQVHEVPLLASPPWINKYYIMDLAPDRSLFEWAIQHQRTVFAISYRNPDETMSDLTMDDYLRLGPLAALEVVQNITRSDKVDILALCLGGALASMAAAYLADESDVLGSITLTNTMLDYTDPGILGFMDPCTLERVDARMGETGFLRAEDMQTTFDLLRPNDLLFNYVVSRWMKGEDPPPFDILAWNDDSTRMPAAMHSAYLDSLYVQNQLAQGSYELAGKTLDLSDITNDTYVLAAINDHIVPWQASYRTTRLLGGDVRFVLSSGGHIAGVVNPPTPKAWHSVGPEEQEYPVDPQEWLDSTEKRSDTWWNDWVVWSSTRAGGLRKPPKIGSRKYPPLEDAPGSYVR